MIVYNTTTEQWESYSQSGALWAPIGGSGGVVSETFTALSDPSGVYLTPEPIGGLAGKSGAELDGVSLNSLLQMMLYPTQTPSYAQATFSLSDNVSNTLYYGSTVSGTLTATYSKGVINTTYTHLDSVGNAAGTNYTGDATEIRIYQAGGLVQTDTVVNSATYTLNFQLLSNTNFSAQVDYSAGDMPYDSNGVALTGEQNSGATGQSSNTIYFAVTHPVYVDLDGDGTFETLLTLKSKGSDYTVSNFSGQVDGINTAYAIKFPLEYGTLNAVYAYNSISGNYDADATASWARAFDITETHNGISQQWALYYYSASTSSGNFKFDFTSTASSPNVGQGEVIP
jgi:hypothetical protein